MNDQMRKTIGQLMQGFARLETWVCKCGHEWQTSDGEQTECDWCGKHGRKSNV